MNFQYNENGCRQMIAVYEELLRSIKHDIGFLELESSNAVDLEVRMATDEALAKRQLDRSRVEIKIYEFRQQLATVPGAPGSAKP